MKTLPPTFARENEDYITLLPLKKLAKTGLIPTLKTTMSRAKMLNTLLEFSESSPENEKIVRDWLDVVAKEGIKDVYIKKLNLNFISEEVLKTDEKVIGILEKEIKNINNRNLVGNIYENTLELVKYEIVYDDVQGKVISLHFCRMIHWYCKPKGVYGDWYPVFIDIFVDKGYIVGRAKPKSMMFEFMPNGFDLEMAKRIATQAEIFRAMDSALKYLGLETAPAREVRDIFRSKLYEILKKYTYTPHEIKKSIDDKIMDIERVAEEIRCDICEIGDSYANDIKSDLFNMAEKYFSISFPDKQIFIKDREAYPLIIEATDEEESHVEQTAGLEEPLQSKAIFFDNKKMMQKSGLCDCIKMCYMRQDNIYSSEHFKVKFLVNGGYCMCKFFEFTLEEDIKHVLLTIIDA